MPTFAGARVQFVVVGIGAILGANLRFCLTNWTAARWGADFPYGTFVINVSGALMIGIVLGVLMSRTGVSPLWRLFFATGFLGGYTTFSSYAWEALTLVEEGAWVKAGLYVCGSNMLGFLGVWLGSTIARLLPE